MSSKRFDREPSVKRAWLLNLDAERELARPRGYTTPAFLAEQIRAQHHLIEALCEGEPVVPLDARRRPPGTPARTLVIPWCPTPSALSTIRRLGLLPPAAPPLSVLVRVNHRRFQSEIARSLDPASAFARETSYIEPEGDVEAQSARLAVRLSGAPSIGRGWHLERAFGSAGKGARRLQRALVADDLRWLADSLRQGGLLIEPWVEVTEELSMHGYVDGAELLLGEPCQQVCDAYGAPRSVKVLEPGALPASHTNQLEILRDTARRAGLAIRAQGYWGPFGVDAFFFKEGGGVVLNPLSDLNARFTLGWSIGMGQLRETALQRLEAHEPR